MSILYSSLGQDGGLVPPKKVVKKLKPTNRIERQHEPNETKHLWQLTKEKILMFSGLMLIAFETINAEVLGRTFHTEFVLAGLALCGVSIAQWGDKK